MKNKKLKTFNAKEITLLKVRYEDFENLVQEVYSKDYSFTSDIECGNDSSHFFEDITGHLSEYDEGRLEEFVKSGEYTNLASVLLQDLCRKNLVTKGSYLIKVYW